jgi:hypothetical protein
MKIYIEDEFFTIEISDDIYLNIDINDNDSFNITEIIDFYKLLKFEINSDKERHYLCQINRGNFDAYIYHQNGECYYVVYVDDTNKAYYSSANVKIRIDKDELFMALKEFLIQGGYISNPARSPPRSPPRINQTMNKRKPQSPPSRSPTSPSMSPPKSPPKMGNKKFRNKSPELPDMSKLNISGKK